jgi:hypothetical protein
MNARYAYAILGLGFIILFVAAYILFERSSGGTEPAAQEAPAE